MSLKPIPEELHRVTPYLLIEGAEQLIAFAQKAFGAELTNKLVLPGGRVQHAQIRIGDTTIMMGEPKGMHPLMPASLYIYVEDNDATYARALEAGASSVMEPADQFYGDRNSGVKDPVGNVWWIATRKENLTAEEVARRAESFAKTGEY